MVLILAENFILYPSQISLFQTRTCLSRQKATCLVIKAILECFLNRTQRRSTVNFAPRK